jgi:hypothetical protein
MANAQQRLNQKAGVRVNTTAVLLPKKICHSEHEDFRVLGANSVNIH